MCTFQSFRFTITWLLKDHIPAFIQTACFTSSTAVLLCVPLIVWTNIPGWANECAMGKTSDVFICDILMHWLPCIITYFMFEHSEPLPALFVNLLIATLYMHFVDWNPKIYYEPSGLSNRSLMLLFVGMLLGVHVVLFIQTSS